MKLIDLDSEAMEIDLVEIADHWGDDVAKDVKRLLTEQHEALMKEWSEAKNAQKRATMALKCAIAQVEWEYPLDYVIAFQEAILALMDKEEKDAVHVQG